LLRRTGSDGGDRLPRGEGEITSEQANELRERIRREGLRSIVEKREEGYYLRRYWLR